MSDRQRITTEEARSIGMRLGVDWATIELGEFRRGLEVELEHGARDAETDVTNDDLALTGKIAWAHLKEIRDYYTRLDRLAAEARAEAIGIWPLHGGKPNPEPAAMSGADDFGGVILAFSDAHTELISRLHHIPGNPDEKTRRARPPATDSSGADLSPQMNEG